MRIVLVKCFGALYTHVLVHVALAASRSSTAPQLPAAARLQQQLGGTSAAVVRLDAAARWLQFYGRRSAAHWPAAARWLDAAARWPAAAAS